MHALLPPILLHKITPLRILLVRKLIQVLALRITAPLLVDGKLGGLAVLGCPCDLVEHACGGVG
jgi:hypothetical protein